MITYVNDKGATITSACEIAGGGWKPVHNGTEIKQNTRADKEKEPKSTAKRKRNE